MKSLPTFVLAVLVSAGTLALARNASALGPVDLEIAAKVGGGSSLESNGPNPLGFGLGGRAGVSFFGLYGGVAAMYYFGESQTEDVGGTSFKTDVHTVTYGIEGGYNISILGLVTVRPQIGVGNLTITADVTSDGISASNSESDLYLEPGVTGLFTLGPVLVGADVNALWVPSLNNSNVAVTVHGQAGVKF